MTEYTKKSFSVALSLSEEGKANYDKIFKAKSDHEREKPLSPEDLAAWRAEQVRWNNELGRSPEKFTCDTCSAAPLCRLAFDGYNTDGDCLAEK